jgi:hypothetical protein
VKDLSTRVLSERRRHYADGSFGNRRGSRDNAILFYELHVWAWQHNPHGAFVDWNTLVSCEGE